MRATSDGRARRSHRTGDPRRTAARARPLRHGRLASTTASRTLIGRLLYDTKSIFEDQLEHVERPRSAAARLRQPRAAHRRPACRARAGHHDRRRLPLLRHAAAQVHHRRHARPRAVHAQHGHRRLDRRPRADPARRPQRRDRAVAPARASSPRCCASRTSSSCVNKMDLVDWDEEVFDEIVREFTGWAASSSPDMTFMPISALQGDNVVERSEQHALVRGPAAAAPPGARARRRRPQPERRPLPGAVGHPADVRRAARLPRLCRQVAPACSGPATRCVVLPSGRTTRDRGDRDLRRRARRGVPAAVGDAAPRGRHRRLARRHDLPRRRTAPSRRKDLDAIVCWMSERPLAPAGRYRLKHTSRTALAKVTR